MKDGSEERLIFSANAQAASNDTSLDENGQESDISVVSKVRSSMHPYRSMCMNRLHRSMMKNREPNPSKNCFNLKVRGKQE